MAKIVDDEQTESDDMTNTALNQRFPALQAGLPARKSPSVAPALANQPQLLSQLLRERLSLDATHALFVDPVDLTLAASGQSIAETNRSITGDYGPVRCSFLSTIVLVRRLDLSGLNFSDMAEAATALDAGKQVLRATSHPNLAGYVAASLTAPYLWVVSRAAPELVSLRTYCRDGAFRHRRGRRGLLQVLRNICAGLAHLHRNGVPHGALGPEIIMLGPNNELEIMWPGSAMIKCLARTTAPFAMDADAALFAAPELLDGKLASAVLGAGTRTSSPSAMAGLTGKLAAADMWAVASLVWFVFDTVFSGMVREPYRERREGRLRQRPPTAVLPWSGEVPPSLRSMVERCWQLDASRRPTVAELLGLLDSLLGSEDLAPGSACSTSTATPIALAALAPSSLASASTEQSAVRGIRSSYDRLFMSGSMASQAHAKATLDEMTEIIDRYEAADTGRLACESRGLVIACIEASFRILLNHSRDWRIAYPVWSLFARVANSRLSATVLQREARHLPAVLNTVHYAVRALSQPVPRSSAEAIWLALLRMFERVACSTRALLNLRENVAMVREYGADRFGIVFMQAASAAARSVGATARPVCEAIVEHVLVSVRRVCAAIGTHLADAELSAIVLAIESYVDWTSAGLTWFALAALRSLACDARARELLWTRRIIQRAIVALNAFDVSELSADAQAALGADELAERHQACSCALALMDLLARAAKHMATWLGSQRHRDWLVRKLLMHVRASHALLLDMQNASGLAGAGEEHGSWIVFLPHGSQRRRAARLAPEVALASGVDAARNLVQVSRKLATALCEAGLLGELASIMQRAERWPGLSMSVVSCVSSINHVLLHSSRRGRTSSGSYVVLSTGLVAAASSNQSSSDAVIAVSSAGTSSGAGLVASTGASVRVSGSALGSSTTGAAAAVGGGGAGASASLGGTGISSVGIMAMTGTGTRSERGIGAFDALTVSQLARGLLVACRTSGSSTVYEDALNLALGVLWPSCPAECIALAREGRRAFPTSAEIVRLSVAIRNTLNDWSDLTDDETDDDSGAVADAAPNKPKANKNNAADSTSNGLESDRVGNSGSEAGGAPASRGLAVERQQAGTAGESESRTRTRAEPDAIHDAPSVDVLELAPPDTGHRQIVRERCCLCFYGHAREAVFPGEAADDYGGRPDDFANPLYKVDEFDNPIYEPEPEPV